MEGEKKRWEKKSERLRTKKCYGMEIYVNILRKYLIKRKNNLMHKQKRLPYKTPRKKHNFKLINKDRHMKTFINISFRESSLWRKVIKASFLG